MIHPNEAPKLPSVWQISSIGLLLTALLACGSDRPANPRPAITTGSTASATTIAGTPCGTDVCPFIELAVACANGSIVFGGGSVCVDDDHCEDVIPVCPDTRMQSTPADSGCRQDFDCPVLAYCIPCANGTCVGPTPACIEGQCHSIRPVCAKTPQCQSNGDCAVPAYCRVCEDGSCVSPTAECLEGQCVGHAPVCPENP